MITGVLLVLLGEAALFGSPWILAWAAAFFAVNAVWFPLVEEPGLVRALRPRVRGVPAGRPALATAPASPGRP